VGTAFKHPSPCRVNGSKLNNMYNNKLFSVFLSSCEDFLFSPFSISHCYPKNINIVGEMLVTYSFSNTYVSLKF